MMIARKIIFSVLAAGAILFCGGIAALYDSFAIPDILYLYLIAAVTVLLCVFAILSIWNLFQPKIRRKIYMVTAALLLLTVFANEMNKLYIKSIEIVNEQSVDLSLYEPFRENTLAVSLNEPSTLNLTDNLPKLDGATALYPLYSAFVKATYPAATEKIDGIVACTNTGGAYDQLLNGKADIIFVAGPSKNQIQWMKDSHIEMKFTPIGSEAFVFFVNAKNPVSDLSTTDIQKIYAGEVTNWKDVGGRNTSIRAFQRPEDSGSQTALLQIMGDVPLMAPPAKDVMGGMGDIINQVSSYQNFGNSIGYSFLFYATEMVKDNKIKLLSINGIAPARENIANKTYPYSGEFFAVTAGTKNPNTDKLITWIVSKQGQYLVDKTGYTPLAPNELWEFHMG